MLKLFIFQCIFFKCFISISMLMSCVFYKNIQLFLFHSIVCLELLFSKPPLKANPCLIMQRTSLNTWPPYLLRNHGVPREHLTLVCQSLLIMRQQKVCCRASFAISTVCLMRLLGYLFFLKTMFRKYLLSILFHFSVSIIFFNKFLVQVKNINSSLLLCAKD